MTLKALSAILALSCVAACAPDTRYSDRSANSLLDQEAFFTDFPVPLFVAAAQACSGPGDTLVREARGTIRCEVLPSPPDAASLILAYGGTIEDLPRYVIAFDTDIRDDGYVVRNEAYIRVPKLEGGEVRIKSPDARRTRDIREIFAAAGGTLITP